MTSRPFAAVGAENVLSWQFHEHVPSARLSAASMTTLLFALVIAGVAPADGHRLIVDVAADTHLPCPAHRLIVDALALRAPRLLVWRDVPSGETDLQLVVATLGDIWRLTLQRRGGSLALERNLPAHDCRELGDAVALIVERYLATLAWPGLEEPLPLAPVPPITTSQFALIGEVSGMRYPGAFGAGAGAGLDVGLSSRTHALAMLGYAYVRPLHTRTGTAEVRQVLVDVAFGWTAWTFAVARVEMRVATRAARLAITSTSQTYRDSVDAWQWTADLRPGAAVMLSGDKADIGLVASVLVPLRSVNLLERGRSLTGIAGVAPMLALEGRVRP